MGGKRFKMRHFFVRINLLIHPFERGMPDFKAIGRNRLAMMLNADR